MWVLGAIDRQTNNCFLVPCPGIKKDAATLLPIINRWILPGSIVHTDEWSAYNGLTAAGFTHETVNHSIQFVEPLSLGHTRIPKRDSGSMLREQLLVLEILKCL